MLRKSSAVSFLKCLAKMKSLEISVMHYQTKCSPEKKYIFQDKKGFSKAWEAIQRDFFRIRNWITKIGFLNFKKKNGKKNNNNNKKSYELRITEKILSKEKEKKIKKTCHFIIFGICFELINNINLATISRILSISRIFKKTLISLVHHITTLQQEILSWNNKFLD